MGHVREEVDNALSEAASSWLGVPGQVDISTVPRDELLVGITAAVRALMTCVQLLADEIEFR